MSDMQMQGPRRPGGLDPVRKNMSMINPIDMAAMKQEGLGTRLQSMTAIEAFTEVFTRAGFDPNGPATQLVEFGRKQVENADMAGKMQNIAAETESQPVPPAGLEGLLGARNGN